MMSLVPVLLSRRIIYKVRRHDRYSLEQNVQEYVLQNVEDFSKQIADEHENLHEDCEKSMNAIFFNLCFLDALVFSLKYAYQSRQVILKFSKLSAFIYTKVTTDAKKLPPFCSFREAGMLQLANIENNLFLEIAIKFAFKN
jgi:hypothetical protein